MARLLLLTSSSSPLNSKALSSTPSSGPSPITSFPLLSPRPNPALARMPWPVMTMTLSAILPTCLATRTTQTLLVRLTLSRVTGRRPSTITISTRRNLMNSSARRE
ncbi:hypothetical protein I305_04127 [Cryptococcus gattii E566]|nr:hypothetical protein I305_04127 [Cryptococcus gattii E566]